MRARKDKREKEEVEKTMKKKRRAGKNRYKLMRFCVLYFQLTFPIAPSLFFN